MKLSEYLKIKGISQADYAAKVGVTQGYVSQVIAGRYKLQGTTALSWALATNYEVTPHELNPRIYPNPSDGLPNNGAAA